MLSTTLHAADEKNYAFWTEAVIYFYEDYENRSLSEAELELIDEHPTIIYPLYYAKTEAVRLAHIVCSGTYDEEDAKVHTSRDEIDAMRHFFGSAILAYKIGEDLARTYLNAREYRENPRETEGMDIHNNELGLIWAATIKTEAKQESKLRTFKVFKEKLFSKGQELLFHKELIVLNPSPKCHFSCYQ